MVSQNFKYKISPDILFDLLDKICSKNNDNKYIFNNIAYNKAEYLTLIEPFCAAIMGSYYKTKQFYVTRKHTYVRFLTVIRQICRSLNVEYTSNIEYDKSTYSIVYFIHSRVPPLLVNT